MQRITNRGKKSRFRFFPNREQLQLRKVNLSTRITGKIQNVNSARRFHPPRIRHQGTAGAVSDWPLPAPATGIPGLSPCQSQEPSACRPAECMRPGIVLRELLFFCRNKAAECGARAAARAKWPEVLAGQDVQFVHGINCSVLRVFFCGPAELSGENSDQRRALFCQAMRGNTSAR